MIRERTEEMWSRRKTETWEEINGLESIPSDFLKNPCVCVYVKLYGFLWVNGETKRDRKTKLRGRERISGDGDQQGGESVLRLPANVRRTGGESEGERSGGEGERCWWVRERERERERERRWLLILNFEFFKNFKNIYIS